MSRPLQALFFDVDDTLFSTTAFVARARSAAIDAMIDRGLSADKDLLQQELESVVQEFGSNDARHYNRLFRRMPASATEGANELLVVQAGVIAYHDTKWKELRIPEETFHLLEELSRMPGLALGVITAGLARKQMEKIIRLGLDRFVDPKLLIITDEVGVAKSNPEVYSFACRQAGVQPQEAMHVGDHPLRDMDSAHEAGMITVWHAGSKYADVVPRYSPDYEIATLGHLRDLLARDFDLDLLA